jgi:hypothetical protein
MIWVARQITQDYLMQYTGGWWVAWAKRWFTLVTPKSGVSSIQIFEHEESAKVTLLIPIDTLASVEVNPDDALQFIITTNDGQSYRFQTNDTASATAWVTNITLLKERPPPPRVLTSSNSFVGAPTMLAATGRSSSFATSLTAFTSAASSTTTTTTTGTTPSASASASVARSVSSSCSGSSLMDEVEIQRMFNTACNNAHVAYIHC